MKSRGIKGLRIYGVARTRAFRALWVAEELGIPYEHLPVEIGDAGARTPEFLALNPNGRLPVIIDGDFVPPRNRSAITLYLAKKHAPGKLYPAKLEDEARVWQWSFRAIAEVDRGVNIFGRCMRCACRQPSATPPCATRRGRSSRRRFGVLDAAVAQQPYLLGPDFTIADLNVAAVISRRRRYGSCGMAELAGGPG